LPVSDIMTNLAVSTITKTLTKQIIIKLMKITQFRKNEDTIALSVMDLDILVNKIKTEIKSRPVSTFREHLRHILPDERCMFANKLPQIIPAAEFRKVNGQKQMKNYNGIVELTIGPLSNKSEITLVKQKACEQPQTRCVFMGSSGKTVKIWTTFTRPDNSLPKTREEAELFHAHAYRLAVKCYQPMLPFDIDLKEPVLAQRCRMTLDESPYYNPDAVPFCLEQPLTMLGEETFRQRKQGEKNPLLRLQPGYESAQTFTKIYEAALNRALQEMEDWKRGDDLQPLLVRLAEHCFKAGLPEEEAIRQTMIHYYREEEEQVIRSILHNLYQECKGFGKKSSINKEQETAFLLEEFMKRRYEFRYNTVQDDLEYRQRDSVHFCFKPVDKRVRNSIAINALKEGISAWDRDVDRFLNSECVPLYNPVEEYLYETGRWDGKDRIRALAGLVPCDNPHWQELFYRWFLSMVAHWRGVDRQHGNNTSPLLVGSQGYRKSTFCRIILPPELRFGYTDSIDFKSKQEAERYLGRFFLINIDEFDQINVSQQGFLKHLLQKPVANLRKPYGNTIREMRRYASFIGTSNQKDLLTDPSGSRCFICIEVTAPIQTNVTINYKQLYAQAMEAIYKGERYWLNDEDENILKQTNREFEQVSPLEQLFHCYLNPVEEEMEGEWLTAMQILSYLQTKTRDKLAINKVGQFGRALQKLNIPCRKSRKGTLYHLMKVK
jgi:hypothetical protein